MSAYLVTQETINCCCAGWRLPYERQIDDCAELDNIGRQLWQMNADAVDQRYPSDAADAGELPEFKFRQAIYSPIQTLKCLECLLYQCSEGNIDQRPLYAELESRVGKWAQHIVNNSPEWKAAKWGLPDRPEPQPPAAGGLLAKVAQAAIKAAAPAAAVSAEF